MRIAVDIDGVLRDFVRQFILVYTANFPKIGISSYEGWSWELEKNIGTNLTAKQVRNWWTKDRPRDILVHAKVHEDAKEGFNLLLNSIHHPVIVSNQVPGTEHHTLEWLGRHEINAKEIIFTKDKLISECEIIIDDHIDNLAAFESQGKMAIAITRPWNSDWHGKRFTTLKEAAQHVIGH